MTVIQFQKPKPKEPHCAFCKRPKDKVLALVGSTTGAMICDKCIKQAKERLNDV